MYKSCHSMVGIRIDAWEQISLEKGLKPQTWLHG